MTTKLEGWASKINNFFCGLAKSHAKIRSMNKGTGLFSFSEVVLWKMIPHAPQACAEVPKLIKSFDIQPQFSHKSEILAIFLDISWTFI